MNMFISINNKRLYQNPLQDALEMIFCMIESMGIGAFVGGLRVDLSLCVQKYSSQAKACPKGLPSVSLTLRLGMTSDT